MLKPPPSKTTRSRGSRWRPTGRIWRACVGATIGTCPLPRVSEGATAAGWISSGNGGVSAVLSDGKISTWRRFGKTDLEWMAPAGRATWLVLLTSRNILEKFEDCMIRAFFFFPSRFPMFQLIPILCYGRRILASCFLFLFLS